MCYFNLANSRRVVEEKENIQTLKRKSLISMLHLIGWEADAVDLHQSRSGFKQTRWKGQSLHYILPFSGKQTQACARGVFLHFSPWVNVIKLPLFFSYLGHIVSWRPGHLATTFGQVALARRICVWSGWLDFEPSACGGRLARRGNTVVGCASWLWP